MQNRLSVLALIPAAGLAGLVLGGLFWTQAKDPALEAPSFAPVLRRPVALALTDEGKWLFVANRSSGTITTIDSAKYQSVAEVAVGQRLADLTPTPDARHLLTVDEANDELILLRRQGPSLEIAHRLKVSPAPVSVRVAPDGSRAFVASLWSRKLTFVELAAKTGGRSESSPRVVKTVPLAFAPRQQLLVRDGTKLIVADSFGGSLAVVDTGTGAVESVRSLPGHNIRGLALSRDGQRVLVAHQVLSSLATSSLDDIHWGNLLTNNVRFLALDTILNPGDDLLRGSYLEYLGGPGRGAADPADVAVGPDGTLVVALGGVGEVAIRWKMDTTWQRGPVGQRPTALLLQPGDLQVYVANTFSDSVSVVRLLDGKVIAEIPLGPKPGLTRSQRGEQLFYSGRLSLDGWLSCHSCHSDGHSNGLLNDNLTDGSYGTPKRVLSLLGVESTIPWAWDGSMPDLESQIRMSVRSTMQGKGISEEEVQDLAAYLRTLKPAPGLGRFAESVDKTGIERGRKVFQTQACDHCHTPPNYTSRQTYDVGTGVAGDTRAFNPPSLRGVSQGNRYFHDNRAANLEEIFTRHRHQLKTELTKQELADLLTFLRSL
jgi:YVTN family beta-propeller protein